MFFSCHNMSSGSKIAFISKILGTVKGQLNHKYLKVSVSNLSSLAAENNWNFKTMNSKHLAKGSNFPELSDGKLRIYNMRFCPYAQRAVLVAEAKNIPHDIINVNLVSKPEWLFERNPMGKVPTIETKNGPLYESLIVVDYMDEVYPGRKINSENPYTKASDRIWIENFSKVSTIFYKLAIHGPKESDEVNLERIKELAEALSPLEAELKRRGTLFYSGSEPGLIDYMIWPWMERVPVLRVMFPSLYDYEAAKIQNPCLEKWRQAMKEDKAVKASYISPQDHYKFLLSHQTGSPNYDLLAE